MSATGPEAAKEVITYDFDTCAQVFAVQDAYWEVGMFREVRTPEQQKLYDALAAVDVEETVGLVGTAEDLQETADLLREWGEANALSDIIPTPRKSGERADTPKLRTVIARVAVTMAEDIEAKLGGRQIVDPNLDMDAVYAFLDGEAA